MGDRASLEAAYAAIPQMNCKGLCGYGCGPVGYSALENERMQENGAIPPAIKWNDKHGGAMCSHLTENERCAIYENRPLICRLFGAVQRLRCQHGCKPVGGFLTQERVMELFQMCEDGRPPLHALPEMRWAEGDMAAAMSMFFRLDKGNSL